MMLTRNVMRDYLDKLYKWSGIVAACFILAICMTVSLQVCFNIVDRLFFLFSGSAIGLVLPSYADFAGYFLASASFLAAASALKSGDHIRVELIIEKLSPNHRVYTELWSSFIGAAITSYCSWWSVNLVHESWKYGDLSPGIIAVPIWIPQMSMAIGLIILAIAFADKFVLTLIHSRENSLDLSGDLSVVDK
ncbi:MAG: TRAP transporter small permease [Methyloligellaceae bacterium]